MVNKSTLSAKVSGFTSQRNRSKTMLTEVTLATSEKDTLIIFNKDKRNHKKDAGFFIPEVGHQVETASAIYKLKSVHERITNRHKKCIFVAELIRKKSAQEEDDFNSWLRYENILEAIDS